MPLQQRELLRGDRFFHVQGIEHLGLFGADGRDTSDGFGSVEPDLVMLDTADGKTSWRLYEELFESGAVYLELNGVSVELEVSGQAQTRLVLRLPLDMARRLATAKVTPAQWDDIAKDRTLGKRGAHGG
jgi:hypothetical protein